MKENNEDADSMAGFLSILERLNTIYVPFFAYKIFCDSYHEDKCEPVCFNSFKPK